MKVFSKQLRIVCGFLAACLLSFCLAGCQTNKNLTLENFSDYINVYATTGSGHGNGFVMFYTAYARFSKKEGGIKLEDVVVKFILRASETENTYTESLQDLKDTFSKEMEFEHHYSYETSMFPTVSVEVLEISGQFSREIDPSWIPVIFLSIIVVLAIMFAIAYYVRLSAKVGSIREGMTLAEVIAILGEPSERESNGNITTVIWKRYVRNFRRYTYCTVTLKDGVVISKIT